MVSSGRKNLATDIVKPDFYIKNVLGGYYDRRETPIVPEG